MKILVLLKQVPANLDARFDTNYNIDRSVLEKMLNPADASALSIAFSLIDYDGGTVSCISMGPSFAVDCLREAAIMGADDLTLISDKAFIGADTFVTASVLARAISQMGRYDLILCGNKSVDGETGQVGPEISELLNVTCLTNVTSVSVLDGGMIRCKRLLEESEQTFDCQLPALVSICPFPVPAKLPTILQLRTAKQKPIREFTAKDLGLSEDYSAIKRSPTSVIAMAERGAFSRTCQYVDASSICELVKVNNNGGAR